MCINYEQRELLIFVCRQRYLKGNRYPLKKQSKKYFLTVKITVIFIHNYFSTI